jgi:hypothetical protein
MITIEMTKGRVGEMSCIMYDALQTWIGAEWEREGKRKGDKGKKKRLRT